MDLSNLIMAAMTVATFLSVIVAVYSALDTKRRYFDSILPIISFTLFTDYGRLNLEVSNTGKSPARKLTIQIIHISNLTEDYNLNCSKVDCLSGVTFDLFPEETVCTHIYVSNTIVPIENPLVKLKLSYVDDWDNEVTEERTIFVCR